MPRLESPRRSLIVLGVALLIGCSASQSDGTAQHTVGGDAGVAAVATALNESVVAWNRGDLDAHVAIYADSGTGGPPIAPGGRARARANLARYFTPAPPRLAIDSLRVRALGSDHVLATGRWTLGSGAEQRSGWFTEVWAGTPAGWKIIHEQTQ